MKRHPCPEDLGRWAPRVAALLLVLAISSCDSPGGNPQVWTDQPVSPDGGAETFVPSSEVVEVTRDLPGTPTDAIDISSDFHVPPTDAIDVLQDLHVPPTDAIDVLQDLHVPPTDAIDVLQDLHVPPTDAIDILQDLHVPPTDLIDVLQDLHVPPTDAIDVPQDLHVPPTDAIDVLQDLHVPPTDAIDVLQDLHLPPTDAIDDTPVLHDVPPEDAAPPLGEFGFPCSDPAQCNSGFCVDSPNGRICTTLCVENCPAGWTCKYLGDSGGSVSVCVPLFLHLCEPCTAASDCNGELTGGRAVCIDRDLDGKFCGADCSQTGHCPPGYACEATPDGAGGLPGVALQCVPEGGAECRCSARAIGLGLQTECFVAGDAGICKGSRRCRISGLTPCDARTPQLEDCNGIDDDCNGLTDELQGKFPCSITNEWGTCSGQGDCIRGGIANCTAAKPVKEACNGMDDNCNGEIDEGLCDDGNPCTLDYCNQDRACVNEPYPWSCEDLNPCTINDHCDGSGQCVGGSPKNCDDNDPCTDDGCDSGTGKCLHLNNRSPCEDSNYCTTNDTCLAGVCRGGPARDCTDQNACTRDERCDPATGACISTPNDGIACDDGNGCTINDTCSGGQCIGPTDWCDTQSVTCVPPPGKTACLAPKCVMIPIVNMPSCPCICI